MPKPNIIASAITIMLLLPVTWLVDAQETLSPPASASADNQWDLKSFYADFKPYAIGDIVAEIYRTKPYEITAWQIRHLPAPVPDSHWTYMGGNYVLITNVDGRILRAVKGDIFYQR